MCGITQAEQAGVAVMLCTYIQEVFGSNLGRDPDYHDCGFSPFSSIPPDKYQNSKSIRQRPLPSKSFPIHQTSYHSTMYSQDTENSVPLLKICVKQEWDITFAWDEMGRACSTNGAKRNAYRILVGNTGGERPLGRPRRTCEDNNKMDIREIWWGGMDWIDQDRDQWRAIVNTVINLVP
jgi:hypothetical protein